MERVASWLQGRVWSPCALAVWLGSAWAEGSFSPGIAALAAVAWLLVVWGLIRRGRTLLAPAAAWLAMCLAAGLVAQARTCPAVISPPDPPMRGRTPPMQVLRVDSAPLPVDGGLAFEGTWLATCALGGPRPGGCRSRRGGLRVHLRGPARPPPMGAVLRAPAFVAPPPGYGNPGSDRLRQMWARSGRSGRVAIASGSLRQAPAGGRSAPPPLTAMWRTIGGLRTAAALRLAALLPGRSGGVLRALGLGDRGGIDVDLRRTLRDSGTAHILAVSGAHVALVVALVAGLLRLLIALFWVQLLRRWSFWQLAAAPCLLAAWTYVLLTGAAESTLRAATMATVALTVRAAAARFDLAESLGLAAVLLVLAWPDVVHDVGLQLSILGVAGVALGRQIAVRQAGAGVRPGALLLAFFVSVGAAASTASVAVPVFGQLPLLAPLANLLIVPWVALVLLPLALAVVGLTFGIEATGTSLPHVVAVAVRGMTDLAVAPLHAAVEAPDWLFVTWRVGGLQATLIGLIVPIAFGGWLWVRWRRLWLALCLALALATGPLIAAASQPAPSAFMAWFLDVGHGDAIVLRLPGGRIMLVDGGGESGDDGRVGERAVLPALRHLGIRRIDVMVLSHPHPDHENGLLAIARALPVAEIWWTGDHAHSAEHERLIQTLRRQGTRWRQWDAALSPPGCARVVFGEVVVSILWPSGAGTVGVVGGNDRSLVVEVAAGSNRLLLSGDVERAAERGLLRQRGLLRSVAILKVPHHGSLTSSTGPFLRRLAPYVAVAGARSWGQLPFPHPVVSARYQRHGIALWATESGAARLHMDAQGWCIAQGARSACSSGASRASRR